MLKRILSAAVALPLFLIVLFWAPEWALSVLMCALCALACYEMLHAAGLCRSRILLGAALLLSAGILPLTIYTGLDSALGVLLCGIVLFLCAVLSGGKIDFREIFTAFLASTFLPLALGAVLRIRRMDYGILLVLLPFMAAWLTDTFAYFSGMLFGRHHIAPKISPKKTLEGCVGGTLLCVAASMALLPIAHTIWDVSLSAPRLALVMLAASILSQFGDLSMSYIKRGAGIKDYGKLMPGHGGVLDRFDSVLFSAPTVEILLVYFSVIV